MSSPDKRPWSAKPKPDHNTAPLDVSMLQNVPPHNIEAERGVVASLLIDPLIVDDIVILLSEDDFYSDANRRLYKHLKEMRSTGSAIDLELLLDRLRKSEEIEAVGGQAYIAELLTTHHISAHAVYYAGIVREKSTLRRLIHAGSTIVQEAFAPGTEAKDLMNRAAQRMFDLSDTHAGSQVFAMNDVMMETMSYINNLMAGEHDGISTGFVDLDFFLDGLRPNELTILAARPGEGKTTLGMNIAEHVAIDQKKPVLVVSLEMAKRELALRMVCSRAEINSGRIRKKILQDQDYGRLQTAIDELSRVPMFLDDTPGRTISEIAAVARRLKRQENLQLVVIDYLTLITADNPADPRQEQVAKMARRLKGLARELRLPVLCLAQLNRQMETGRSTNVEPKLSHLRESGAIEQDADVVLLIYRKTIKSKTPGDPVQEQTFINVAKNRAGATGRIEVIFEKGFNRFVSKPREPGDESTEHAFDSDFDRFGAPPESYDDGADDDYWGGTA